MPNIRGPEMLILLLIVLVLFGSKRLPDAARSVGRSLRIFKAETKGLVESEVVPADAPAVTPAAQQATPPPVPDVDATLASQPAPQAQPPSQA
jgi:sec-independent protein translocase protein TatA